MAHYQVYLEGNDGDGWRGHVPALPGCMVGTWRQDAALFVLPAVITGYHAWLRRHGEAAPDPQPITLEVAEVATGFAPIAHGDQAHLFPPDLEPLSRADLERYLQLAAYSRADLLALVRGLPKTILDWQATPGALTIRQIVRHIGTTEQFYVSRLVDPATLPPQWADDARLPWAGFLAMERRTAVARLRQLSDAERAAVVTAPHATAHPDEPWTARKALRRLLEHEQEHLGQVHEVLTAWRAQLLARLAAARADLLIPLVGLDEATTTTKPVIAEGWTSKDVLAHVAAWDELFAERITLITTGQAATMQPVDLDARNEALYAERREWSLAQAMAQAQEARAMFLAALAGVGDADLHRAQRLPVGTRRIRDWVAWRARHDAAHARPIARLRKTQKPRPGPIPVLLAALAAARQEVEAVIETMPYRDRYTRHFPGDWTVQTMISHLLGWDRFVLDGLPAMLAGTRPHPAYEGDIDAWNAASIAATEGQPWPDVWAAFGSTRAALLAALAPLTPADYLHPFPSPWQPDATLHGFLRIWLHHEREHAEELRAALAGEAHAM